MGSMVVVVNSNLELITMNSIPCAIQMPLIHFCGVRIYLPFTVLSFASFFLMALNSANQVPRY